ncbi:MAG: hypothetical protein KC442_19825 [Thermomicrobiales bacterium]|nr:hypothetical protein [Thermomicrobiales bacterium]
MAFGPMEMLMIRFPSTEIGGDLAPALTQLVEDGLIHIVDLLFIRKDAAGKVSVFELSDLLPDISGQYAPLLNDVTELLNDDDAHELAGSLENNSAAGIMLFENVWATRFAQAVRAANGEVLLNERIPNSVIEEIVAATN